MKRESDVVILRGAGRYFSAGRDLKDARSWYGSGQTLDQQREMASLGYRMARAWEELPQITIAAIEGYALGGGLALALACDWRVLAEDAVVGDLLNAGTRFGDDGSEVRQAPGAVADGGHEARQSAIGGEADLDHAAEDEGIDISPAEQEHDGLAFQL